MKERHSIITRRESGVKAQLSFHHCDDGLTDVLGEMDLDEVQSLKPDLVFWHAALLLQHQALFLPSDVEELVDFCAKNPTYHIISAIGGGILVNRYDAKGRAFRLAEGDKDPNYALSGEHPSRYFGKAQGHDASQVG